MAKKQGIKFKRDAFRDIRNHHAVRADILARAERIAAQAASISGDDVDPEDYMVTDLVLEKSRAAASVMAIKSAHHANREDNTLLRALEAGRD